MKTFRRLICVFLSVCLIAGGIVSAGAQSTFSDSIFTDMDENSPYASEAKLLKTLGVLSGDDDGALRPNDLLTRAEFAKLAVCMMNKQKEAVSNSGAGTYTDLAQSHWAMKYINYVSKNGIILGYPDGSFHPDESISFAQAVTVTLRMLGYGSSDVGDFWPDNYVQKASSLGLTSSMSYGFDDKITRADTVLLLGRALEADMKTSTAVSKKTLLDNFGYSVIDETIIISSQKNDKSLSAEQVKTTSATYKTLTGDVLDMVGSSAKLYLDDEKRIVMALPLEQSSYKMTLRKSVGDGEYTCILPDGNEEEYTFDENLTIYFEGKQGTYASLEKYMEAGATVTLKGKYDGIWEYAMLEKAEKITPVIATRDMSDTDTAIGSVSITNPDTLRIYRDGYNASMGDIKRNDVIYYNPSTNVMDVYIDKVTGSYDKAYPNKAHVTSISVGGKTFEIETAAATGRLDETAGSFKIGDRVTLLLGKDGKIAGVTGSTGDAVLDYAALIGTDTYISEDDDDKGATLRKVRVMQADGETYEYKVDRDYSTYIGSLMKMSFENGILYLTKSASQSFSGTFDVSSGKLGDHVLADGAVLFDLADYSGSGDAQVTKLTLEDIQKTYIDGSDIITYVVTNSFGDIGIILFDNITNSNMQYGILTARNVNDAGSNVSGTYTVNINGTEKTFTKNSIISATVGMPVKVVSNGQSVSSIQQLYKVASGGSVDALDYNRIKVKGVTYKMDENAVVYKLDTRTMKYVTVSQNDLLASNVASVELWSEATVLNGGIVRVIKITCAVQ